MQTTKSLQQWMTEGARPRIEHYPDFQMTRRLLLANGQSLSVQASATHFCTPRYTCPYEDYCEMEVGFPSGRVESFMQYAEDPESPTDTVYPYLPVTLIEQYVAQSGGIVGFMEDEQP